MQQFSTIVNSVVRRGPRPGSLDAYGIAIGCVLAATLLRLLIDFVAPDSIYLATFIPAVLIAGLVGGMAAGTTATLLGAFIAWWMFLEPRFNWTITNKGHLVSIALYLFAAALIVWTANQYRLMLLRVDEEEKYRRIVVDELSHRVRNKLSTIYAILRHELRGQPEIWDSVSGRLQALSAADDFIARKDGSGDEASGVELRSLLRMETGPFGEDRFTCEGPPVRLLGKLPTVMALMFHELATNAAKYGALSKPQGQVTIVWRKLREGADDIFEVAWTESGGPEVLRPSRRSFGSNLIERSLDGFNGSARLEFASHGVVCRIRIPAEHVEIGA